MKRNENEQIITQLKMLKNDRKIRIVDDVANPNCHFLSSCDSVFREYGYSPFILTEDIISDNFLSLLLDVRTWENLSENSALFSVAYNTLTVICRHYPKRIRTLESMGLWSRMTQVLEAEEKSEMELECQGQDGHIINLTHLISEFLPPLEYSPCHDDLNKIKEGIIYKGRQWTGNEMAEITRTVEYLFPTMMRLCKTEYKDNIHLVILYKMVYWTDMYGTLERFTSIGDLLGLVKSLILMRDNWDVTLIGFALAHVLKERHIKDFQGEKLYLITDQLVHGVWPNILSGLNPWIEEVYVIKTTYWLLPSEMIKTPKRTYEMQFMNSIFERLLQDTRNMTDRYQNLRIFLMEVLGNIEQSKDREAIVIQNGIINFKALVTKVVNAFDAIQVDQVYLYFVQDLFDLAHFAVVPKSYEDVSLGLIESPQFDRVLGPSQNPLELATNPLMKALRVLSILHEVNENWNILFGYLTGKRIVDKSCFISNSFEKILKYIMVAVKNGLADVPSSVVKMAANYPFLFSYNLRVKLFRFLVLRDLTVAGTASEKIVFDVTRNGLVDTVVRNLYKFTKFLQAGWKFKFIGESGSGPGPTKEFYTEFSRDCQRHQLRLWYGEPVENSDGVLYTSSTCGLFPTNSDDCDGTGSIMFSIGMMMGKSIVTTQLMDVSFSLAFYKLILGINSDYQQLFLSDLKNVLPTAFRFVESLIHPLMQKRRIQENIYLTSWEKRKKLEAITVDGCTFEDLFVNFTVPGLIPEVELMKDGADVYLNIDNLEKYLRLLVYKVLYEGQIRNFKKLRSGIELSIPGTITSFFMADEMEKLLCGEKAEHWSVDSLRKNCKMTESLSVESPAVRYLFEVLSELKGNEQSLFLLFATSSSRLPYGGLGSLKPRLTIARKVPLNEDHDACLPSASTCYNTLFISDYSSKEVFKEKLLLAINEGNNSFHFC